MSEELTPEEQQILEQYISEVGGSYPKQEEKHNIYKLLDKVHDTDDNIKSSNLEREEIQPIRVLLNAALYAREMGLNKVEKYLYSKAQVIAKPTLGRDGFFLRAAITQKKELETKTKLDGRKKTWFKKKEGQ